MLLSITELLRISEIIESIAEVTKNYAELLSLLTKNVQVNVELSECVSLSFLKEEPVRYEDDITVCNLLSIFF